MAIRGRSQPQPPIFIRNAAAQIFIAAAIGHIHVVDGAGLYRHNNVRRPAHVIFLHGQPSQVPPRLAPQIHVVDQPRGARLREGAVLQLRAPAPPTVVVTLRGESLVVLARTPPQARHTQTIAQHAPFQAKGTESAVFLAPRRPPPRADIVFLRNPAAPAPPPSAKAPEAVVVLARQRVGRGEILALRAPLPPLAPSKAPEAVVVLAPRPGRPRGEVLALRAPAITPAAPSAKAPEPVVVLAPRRAQLGHAIFLHGARSIVPPRIAPQIHVISLRPQERQPGRVIALRPSRAARVPDRLAPQIHVVLQRRATPPVHTRFLRTGLFVAPPSIIVDYAQTFVLVAPYEATVEISPSALSTLVVVAPHETAAVERTNN